MRWKAYFFLNGPIAEGEYKYDLRSRKSAPAIAQMKDFEDDLIKMVENVKFRKTSNEFLATLKSDMKRINSSPNVLSLWTNRLIFMNAHQRITKRS